MPKLIASEDTGKGRYRRARVVPASRDTNVQWDQSFNMDRMPGWSVHRDPYLLKSHLQGVQIYKHRFKRPKATLRRYLITLVAGAFKQDSASALLV